MFFLHHNVSFLFETHHYGVYARTIRALFHIEIVREVELQLQVGIHRQSVLTGGVLRVRSRPGGTGNMASLLPRQILITAHCGQIKNKRVSLKSTTWQSITQLTFPQSESALAAPSWTPLPRLLPSASCTSSVSLMSQFCSLSPSRWHQRDRSYQCKCVCPHPSGNHGDRSSGSLRWSCDRTACICSRGPPDIRQSLREKSRNEAWCEKKQNVRRVFRLLSFISARSCNGIFKLITSFKPEPNSRNPYFQIS